MGAYLNRIVLLVLLFVGSTAEAQQTSRYFGDDQYYTPNSFSLKSNTSDGADSKEINICGGGAAASTRGGLITVSGNEEASNGAITIAAGSDIVDGTIYFKTASADNPTGSKTRWSIPPPIGPLPGIGTGDNVNLLLYGETTQVGQETHVMPARTSLDDSVLLMGAGNPISVLTGGHISFCGNDLGYCAGQIQISSGLTTDRSGIVFNVQSATFPVPATTPHQIWAMQVDGNMRNHEIYGGDIEFRKPGSGLNVVGSKDSNAAAGNSQGTATVLVKQQSNYVYGADGTKGVKLWPCIAEPLSGDYGKIYFLAVTGVTGLNIYPDGTEQINGAGAGVPYLAAVNAGHFCLCVALGAWNCG